MEPQQPAPSQPSSPFAQDFAPKQPNIKLVIIGIVIVALAAGVGSYVAVKSSQSSKMMAEPTTAPAQVTADQPTVEPTTTQSTIPADWKTYTDAKYNFTLKYPSNWVYKFSETRALNQTDVPAFLNTAYFANFTIKNNLKTNGDPLFMSIQIFNNPENWSVDKLLNYARDGSGIDKQYLHDVIKTTVAGKYALKTKFDPAFTDIYSSYTSPDKKENIIYVIALSGNGAGGSNYAESDPFVVQEMNNFDQMLSTLTFTTAPKAAELVSTTGWITKDLGSMTMKLPPSSDLKKQEVCSPDIKYESCYLLSKHDPNHTSPPVFIGIKQYNGGSRRQEAPLYPSGVENYSFTDKMFGKIEGLEAIFQCKISECTALRNIIFVVGNKLVYVTDGIYKDGKLESPITDTIISSFATK